MEKTKSRGIRYFGQLCLAFLVCLSIFTGISTLYLHPPSARPISSISMEELLTAPLRLTPDMWMDGLVNIASGLLLGLLTLDPVYTAFSAFVSFFMDLDHAPGFLGLGIHWRVGHSLIFLLFTSLALCWAFKKREPVIVFASAFMMHISLDRLNIPLLSPFVLGPKLDPRLSFLVAPLSFALTLSTMSPLRKAILAELRAIYGYWGKTRVSS